MRTQKTEVEYPGLYEVNNPITSLTSHRPFKASGGETKNQLKQVPADKKFAGNISAIRKSKLKGLCGNCDFVGTCIYDKPASGIWHCNEYQ